MKDIWYFKEHIHNLNYMVHVLTMSCYLSDGGNCGRTKPLWAI